jgi:hypothetical protein
MRYFLLTYVKRPDGKIDEQAQVARRLRSRDWQNCSVILDFKDQRVLMASVDGNTIPHDWDRLYSYYEPYYREIFQDLSAAHAVVDQA